MKLGENIKSCWDSIKVMSIFYHLICCMDIIIDLRHKKGKKLYNFMSYMAKKNNLYILFSINSIMHNIIGLTVAVIKNMDYYLNYFIRIWG